MTEIMSTLYQDLNHNQGWERRSLIVEFQCPAHLMDSINFCRQRGQENDLKLALMNVVRLFVRDASGNTGFDGGPEGKEPPTPGEVTRVIFGPDSRVRPSFTWRAEIVPDKPGAKSKMLLHGGLIYRDNDGWSVHT